jgi:LemA protein
MNLLIVIVFAIFIFTIILYNNLISKVNQIKNAEGALDACLKQRFDLLPNLVEIAKQYMEHEEKMFEKIIALRTKAQTTHNFKETMEASRELEKTLQSFMVNVENYPTLLSNNNFVKLQEALMDLESNIAAGRRFYNAAVVGYNEAIQMIPGNIMAPLIGLYAREIYSIPESERSTPNIKDMFKK